MNNWTRLLCFFALLLFSYEGSGQIKLSHQQKSYGELKLFTGIIDSVLVENKSNRPVYVFTTNNDQNLQIKHPKGKIGAKESAYIYYIYANRKEGKFKSEFTIFTDASDKSFVFTLKGDIQSVHSQFDQACPSFNNPNSKPTISFFDAHIEVYDAKTKLPIDGAQVNIYKGTQQVTEITDRKGNIDLSLMIGLYLIDVNAPTYKGQNFDYYFNQSQNKCVVYLSKDESTKEETVYITQKEEVIEEELNIPDLDVTTNEQIDEVEATVLEDEEVVENEEFVIPDLGVSTNEQLEEHEPTPDPVLASNEEIEEEVEDDFEIPDLGINTNDQLEEVVNEEPSLELEEPEITQVDENEEIISETEEVVVAENNTDFSSSSFKANHIIFLLDVSSSMAKQQRLEQLKSAMISLVGKLREEDRVTIMTYQKETTVLLQAVSGNEKERIIQVIEGLEAQGVTQGENAIKQAFQLAKSNYIENGNNVIILGSDGGFDGLGNSESKTINYIRLRSRLDKISFSVLVFGRNEEGKAFMYKLSKAARGFYIDVKESSDLSEDLMLEIMKKSKKQ